jgi:hypothetical protein
MKFEDIDPKIKAIAKQKHDELMLKYLSVRLKRCEKGSPISSKWEQNWKEYIDNSVSRAVMDYAASKQQRTISNNSPTAAQIR